MATKEEREAALTEALEYAINCRAAVEVTKGDLQTAAAAYKNAVTVHMDRVQKYGLAAEKVVRAATDLGQP